MQNSEWERKRKKNMNNEFLQQLTEERTTYRDMIEFCCDNLILNNTIVEATGELCDGWEIESGELSRYEDGEGNEISKDKYDELVDNGEEANEIYENIFQYYIIGGNDAERLEEYTNETVLYNSNLDMYILCVTHCGTGWDCVPSNWKSIEE